MCCGINLLQCSIPFDSFEPEGPPIMWLQKPGMDYVDFKSRLPGDEVSSHVIRVSCKEENYKIQKRAAEEDFPHHIFHLYPPLIVQNLLPSDIFVGNMVGPTAVLLSLNVGSC